VDQPKDGQRAKYLCISQGGEAAALDCQGHSQTEKGQPVDKKNKYQNGIEGGWVHLLTIGYFTPINIYAL
jgi:hypothetical protein